MLTLASLFLRHAFMTAANQSAYDACTLSCCVEQDASQEDKPLLRLCVCVCACMCARARVFISLPLRVLTSAALSMGASTIDCASLCLCHFTYRATCVHVTLDTRAPAVIATARVTVIHVVPRTQNGKKVGYTVGGDTIYFNDLPDNYQSMHMCGARIKCPCCCRSIAGA